METQSKLEKQRLRGQETVANRNRRKGLRWWVIVIGMITVIYLQISGLIIKEDIGGKVFGQLYPSNPSQQEIGYQGVINKRWWHREWVRIIPDDCVKMIIVNDVQLDLGYLGKEQLCNWGVGFDYPLGRYLKDGRNRVVASISDIGGSYKLGIGQTPRIRNIQLLIFLVVGLLISLETKSLPLVNRLSKLERVVIITAIVLRLLYLFYTPHDVRIYDIQGHKEYIEWVANHWWLPKPDDCIFCHKPPLYYLLTGWLWAVISRFSSNWDILQWWQLLINMGFIYYTVKILENNVVGKYKRLMVLLPVLLLPSSVIHSVRISPEPLYYLFMLGQYYHYLEWARTSEDRHLVRGLWMLLLGFLTTFTAIAYLPIWVVLFVYKSAYKDYELEKGQLGVIGAVVGILSFLGYKLWELKFKGYDLLNGKIVLSDGLKVDIQGLGRYIGIHRDYLSYGIDPWDKGESAYFLNYALTTLLHGEFKIAEGVFKYIAEGMQLGLLIMVVVVLWYIITMRGKQWVTNMDLLLAVSFPISALVWYSYSLPYTPSADFRFIYPTIIPMLLLYIRVITKIKRGLLSVLLRLMPIFLGIGGLVVVLAGVLK